MKKVFLDTNFLMYCAEQRIDIGGELSRVCAFPFMIVILDAVVEELQRLMHGPRQRVARLALAWVRVVKHEAWPSEEYVDDALVKLASADVIVGTHDVELKKRLHGKVGGFLVVRQRSHLALV